MNQDQQDRNLLRRLLRAGLALFLILSILFILSHIFHVSPPPSLPSRPSRALRSFSEGGPGDVPDNSLRMNIFRGDSRTLCRLATPHAIWESVARSNETPMFSVSPASTAEKPEASAVTRGPFGGWSPLCWR